MTKEETGYMPHVADTITPAAELTAALANATACYLAPARSADDVADKLHRAADALVRAADAQRWHRMNAAAMAHEHNAALALSAAARHMTCGDITSVAGNVAVASMELGDGARAYPRRAPTIAPPAAGLTAAAAAAAALALTMDGAATAHRAPAMDGAAAALAGGDGDGGNTP